MSKNRKRAQLNPQQSTEFRKETPAEYLNRGGTITREKSAVGVTLETHELIDRLLGASYDDALTRNVSAFYADSDIRYAIDEVTDQYADEEYA